MFRIRFEGLLQLSFGETAISKRLELDSRPASELTCIVVGSFLRVVGESRAGDVVRDTLGVDRQGATSHPVAGCGRVVSR